MIKPGVYKNSPAGWRIKLKGPNRGQAYNPSTGEVMEFIDFFAWIYGVSHEEAELEIMSLIADREKNN